MSAASRAQSDPPLPPATDRWSPRTITPVRSHMTGGAAGSLVAFAYDRVAEAPGQRLSTAQIEAIAPHLAATFGLPEQTVRAELERVYLYIGGPTSGHNAMTIGHHIYVPDAQQLEQILSPRGRTWLVHELTHTMQFVAYGGSNPHRFLADYVGGYVVGRDPSRPGMRDGPPVWGAAFTGIGMRGRDANELGSPPRSARDRATALALPTAALAVPTGLFAGLVLGTARATTGAPVLGRAHAARTGLGLVAAPAVVGSIIGSTGDRISPATNGAVGAAAGAALGAAALAAGGALRGMTPLSMLAAGAAVGGAALVGGVSAATSSATVHGWSRTAEQERRPNADKRLPTSIDGAAHRSHWMEIEADAVARSFREGASPPERPSARAGARSSLRDRIDWGITIPLLVGLPAAAGAGTAVLAGRTARALLRSSQGGSVGVSHVLRTLGRAHRGVGNSLAIGAALTAVPLVAGGVAGPIAAHWSTSRTRTGAWAGAATGAAAGTALLLAHTSVPSGPWRAALAAGGALLTGALGSLAGSAAAGAVYPADGFRYVTARES